MGQGVEPILPSHLYQLSKIYNQADNIKTAMDQTFRLLRRIFIFDNLAIFNFDSNQRLNAIYGKAVGRGKNAGPDIAWGEMIANKIIETQDIYVDNLPPHENDNRLEQPYYLGVPLLLQSQCVGVLIFIRFGSPPFDPSDRELAVFVAEQISILINRENLVKDYAHLEGQQQQIQSREEFMSNITHELKTPLGGIKGYTTTLLRTDTTWDKATEQEFLQIIDKEADYLQQLIDNLLDSTRLSAGLLKMNFNPIRIDSVIKDAIDHIHISHPETAIKLTTPNPLNPIDGDANRLNQVFLNLFNNAVKYAPETEIWVKIKQGNKDTSIFIQDHGPGISEKNLPYIFDRFFRDPEISPNVHGSGLGLFICKQIVQAHIGQIKAESAVGEGTSFIITIPNSQTRDANLLNTKNKELK